MKKIILIGASFLFICILNYAGVLALPAADDIHWTLIGPGAGGGVEAISIDSADSNTVYLGSDTGIFAKTTNGGKTWHCIGNGRFQNSGDLRSIYSIMVDTFDSNYVYVGDGQGLLKSSNKGIDFKRCYAGLPVLSIARTSDLIVIGTGSYYNKWGGCIYYTLNGSTWWWPVNGIPRDAVTYSIVPDQRSSGRNIVYASTNRGIYKSTDAGKNWHDITGSLPHRDAMQLGLGYKGERSILYVTLRLKPSEHFSGLFAGGVYKSTDEGATWFNANGNLSVSPPTANNTGYSPGVLCVNPLHPDIVYVGGNFTNTGGDIFKTTDGGITWNKIFNYGKSPHINNVSFGWSGPSTGKFLGPANHILVMSPSNPNILYCGGSLVMHKTTNGGSTWEQVYCDEVSRGFYKTRGIDNTWARGLTINPLNPDVVYGVYDDLGIWKSVDHGNSFAMIHPGWNAGCLTLDPETPDMLYLGDSDGASDELRPVFRISANGGKSWTSFGRQAGLSGSGFPLSMALDHTSPVKARTIYLSIGMWDGRITGSGILKSVDGGTTWTSANTGLGENTSTTRVIINPANPDVMLVGIRGVGGSGDPGENFGGLFISKDRAQSWQRLSPVNAMLDVRDIAFDPKDSNIIYAGCRDYRRGSQLYPGGLYKSTDAGKTWRCTLQQPSIGSIAVHPALPRIIYAASEDHGLLPHKATNMAIGLYRSLDGGETWTSVTGELEHNMPSIYAITIDQADPGALYVSTNGGGIFRGMDKTAQNLVK